MRLGAAAENLLSSFILWDQWPFFGMGLSRKGLGNLTLEGISDILEEYLLRILLMFRCQSSLAGWWYCLRSYHWQAWHSPSVYRNEHALLKATTDRVFARTLG